MFKYLWDWVYLCICGGVSAAWATQRLGAAAGRHGHDGLVLTTPRARIPGQFPDSGAIAFPLFSVYNSNVLKERCGMVGSDRRQRLSQGLIQGFHSSRA